MRTLEDRRRRLVRALSTEQADLLAEVITEAYDDLVKVSDFAELKAVVADLAEAQKRTEHGLEELRGSVNELRGTVAELAAAQKRTEKGLDELRAVVQTLAEAQVQTTKEVRELTLGLRDTRRDLGGLTQSMGYAMENEAYRMLPPLLQERYGITLTRRLLRTQIADEEINLFGEGTRNGQPVLVVGEVKLRVDARWRCDDPTLFEDLEEKVEAVKQAYPGREILPVIITHFARPSFLEEAAERGVAVFQSFEW